jgi:hypothetical protein
MRAYDDKGHPPPSTGRDYYDALSGDLRISDRDVEIGDANEGLNKKWTNLA